MNYWITYAAGTLIAIFIALGFITAFNVHSYIVAFLIGFPLGLIVPPVFAYLVNR